LQPPVKHTSDRTLAVEWWVEMSTGKTKWILIAKGKDTGEPVEIP